jgi:hypothetical protein
VCYPKPGPRCSTHARARLATAQERLNEALLRLDAVHVASAMGTGTDAEYLTASRAKEQAEDEMLAAQSVYDSTPAGQRALEDEIAASSPGSISAVEARTRLAAGQAARAEKLAAYRAATGKDADPSDDTHTGPVPVPVPHDHYTPHAQLARATAAHDQAKAAAENARLAYEEARNNTLSAWERTMFARRASGGIPDERTEDAHATAVRDEEVLRLAYSAARDQSQAAWRDMMVARHVNEEHEKLPPHTRVRLGTYVPERPLRTEA